MNKTIPNEHQVKLFAGRLVRALLGEPLWAYSFPNASERPDKLLHVLRNRASITVTGFVRVWSWLYRLLPDLVALLIRSTANDLRALRIASVQYASPGRMEGGA